MSGRSDWRTPPHITAALGVFDLDPCADAKFPTAHALVGFPTHGLITPWAGRKGLGIIMRVQELIERLSGCDRDAEVHVSFDDIDTAESERLFGHVDGVQEAKYAGRVDIMSSGASNAKPKKRIK